MKRIFTVRIALIAVITMLLSMNCLAAEDQTVSKLNWFDRIFKTLSWEEVPLAVNTPEEICSVVRHRIKYKKDLVDEWASGKEAWDRSYGDCEDIAAAVAELCSKKNIEVEMFCIYSESDSVGHVVVVGKWKNRLWFSSNGWFEYAKDGADVKRKVAREMRWEKREVIVAMDWNSFRGMNSDIRPASGGGERIALPIIGM